MFNDNINTKQKIRHHLRKTIIKNRKYWRLTRNAANEEAKIKIVDAGSQI